jgi:hypothetical protein
VTSRAAYTRLDHGLNGGHETLVWRMLAALHSQARRLAQKFGVVLFGHSRTVSFEKDTSSITAASICRTVACCEGVVRLA